MLGERSNPMFKGKAAECKGMLGFILHVFRQHVKQFEKLPPEMHTKYKTLQAAAVAANAFEQSLSGPNHERRYSVPQVQEMLDNYTRFLKLYLASGATPKPKFHFLFHTIIASLQRGSPKAYHTYHDESVNGVISNVAETCYRLTWQEAVFLKIDLYDEVAGSCNQHMH